MNVELALNALAPLWAFMPKEVTSEWLGYGVTFRREKDELASDITLFCQSGQIPRVLRAVLPDQAELTLFGLKVRIVVVQRFVALTGGAAVPADGIVQPGDAVSAQRAGGTVQTGTVGGILRRGGDPVYWLLSTNHSLALNRQGNMSIFTDAGFLPSPNLRCITIGGDPCVADAAAVRLTGVPKASIRLEHRSGLTKREPLHIPDNPSAPIHFQKWGATSGLTKAPLLASRSTVIVDIPGIRANVDFRDQIVVAGHFSQPGDSGSLVVDVATGRPVGIVIAGDFLDGVTGQHLSVISPIAPILSNSELGGPFELMLAGDAI